MRILLMTLALQVALLAAPSGASAVSFGGETVVESTGPGSVELTLDAPATFTSTGNLTNRSLDLAGGGPVYGFVLRRFDDAPAGIPYLFGALRGPIADFCATGACGGEAVESGNDRMYTFGTQPSGGTRDTLQPGRYRMYLVTEPGRSLRVTLRFEGRGGRTEIAADAPNAARVASVARLGDPAFDQAARLGQTAALEAGGMLATITLVRTEVSGGTDIRPCFYAGEPTGPAPYGPDCPTSGGLFTTIVSPFPYIEQELAVVTAPAGIYGLGASTLSASPMARAASYALWLPLDDPAAPPPPGGSDTPPAGGDPAAGDGPDSGEAPLLADVRLRRHGRCTSTRARLRLELRLGRPATVTVSAGRRRVVRRSLRTGAARLTLPLRSGRRCRRVRLTVRAESAEGRRVARRVAVRF